MSKIKGRPTVKKGAEALDATSEIKINPGILPNLLGYKLRIAQISVFKSFIMTFKHLDIRPIQFSIMVIIQANPGLKQSDLSAALAVKRTNMVALLDTLEKRELIKREVSTLDRRAHCLYLTAEGTKFLTEMLEIHDNRERQIEDALGIDGKKQLMELLSKLVAANRTSSGNDDLPDED